MTHDPYALHLYGYVKAAEATQALGSGTLALQPMLPFASPLSKPEVPSWCAVPDVFARILEQVFTLADQRRRGQGWCTVDRQALQQAGAACAGHLQTSGQVETCLQALRGLKLFTRPDHQALWAYYGDDNKGCCLELMIPLRLLPGRWKAHQVRYLPEPPIYDPDDALIAYAEAVTKTQPEAQLNEWIAVCQTPEALAGLSWEVATALAACRHHDWQHEPAWLLLSDAPNAAIDLDRCLLAVHYHQTTAAEAGGIGGLLHLRYPQVRRIRQRFAHDGVVATEG
ncbi:hypothetical protein U5801_24830 [Lamprobacter modestohalophilus]|uniref:hypothetical protein n=1 Tax=Lamprobacter modestohalophilus TaxID=1064514 RepID=UPI002ADEB7F6|nr:hypothetical protein [Lamprobacter modestohalophilus]MEA1053008.1 hypothetical protein [Lamprobacter modestohalophilus]